MSLTEVFCQDKAIEILQRAHTAGRSAHAYIFAGPEGVGKFKTAGQWAKMLLCSNPSSQDGSTDSCGACESCRLFEAGSHPDYHLVYKELKQFTRDGKGKSAPIDLPIDVIREFLVDKVSARPALSARKVFIVTEAEKLNAASQNALLKVLEEPPGYCHIFLICTRMDKLLPTTKSRCQIIRFSLVTEQRIIEKLTEMTIEQKQAQYWARLCGGSMGMACQWAKLDLSGGGLYETKKEVVSRITALKYAEAPQLAQWFLEKNKKIAETWADIEEDTSKSDLKRRAQKSLVQIIISAMHDAMRMNLDPTGEIINFDQKEQIKILMGRYDAEQAGEKIAICYRAQRQIESSVNEKLIFEQLLLSLGSSDIMRD
jgi:DNA polymerase-3 subunit delta'